MRIIIILLIIKYLNILPAKANINIFNDGGIHSNLLTKESSLNQFDSGIISFFDRDLDQLILITNIHSSELRIVFLKDNIAIASWRMPDSSLVKPFSINKIDFYPSEIDGAKTKAGSLLISTNRGDILSNLYTKETKFLQYGRELFSGRYKDIPIIEIDKVNAISK